MANYRSERQSSYINKELQGKCSTISNPFQQRSKDVIPIVRILLVEDNNADARLVEEIIKDSGIEHELIWINDGKKALDRIHSDDDFDLFILDLNIPQASGLSVVSAIRRKENSVQPL